MIQLLTDRELRETSIEQLRLCYQTLREHYEDLLDEQRRTRRAYDALSIATGMHVVVVPGGKP